MMRIESDQSVGRVLTPGVAASARMAFSRTACASTIFSSSRTASLAPASDCSMASSSASNAAAPGAVLALASLLSEGFVV